MLTGPSSGSSLSAIKSLSDTRLAWPEASGGPLGQVAEPLGHVADHGRDACCLPALLLGHEVLRGCWSACLAHARDDLALFHLFGD
jgi:hypothetical protein